MSFVGERDNDDSSRGSNIILLIETTPGNRTFADYKQLYDCQNNIILMFEEDLTVDPAQRDFEGFMKWIDDLYKIQLFEFQPSIGRYRQRTKEELKALFESSPDNGPPQGRAVLQHMNGNCLVNGIDGSNGIDTNSSMRSCSLGEVAEAEDSSDSDISEMLDWDE